MSHVATFTRTDWREDRTTPCTVGCTCGWEAQTVSPDQTHAEWVHGGHLVDEGVLTAEQLTAEWEVARG